MSRYSAGDNPEEMWKRLTTLQQSTLGSYAAYEAQFLKLWNQWVTALREGEMAPNFLKKERFIAGLHPILQQKVRGKFPENFEEAMQWEKLKDQKLQFEAHLSYAQDEVPSSLGNPQPPPKVLEDPHIELLQKVTHQLDNLSINLVQASQVPQPQAIGNQPNVQEPRRPPRCGLFCYNCEEEGHGMYYCPHPRCYGNARGPRE